MNAPQGMDGFLGLLTDVVHDWPFLLALFAYGLYRADLFVRHYYVLVVSRFDRKEDLSQGPLDSRYYMVFDEYAAAAATLASLENPPGRLDDEYSEAHHAIYAVEAWSRPQAKAKAHTALEKISKPMKEAGKVGNLGILIAATDADGMRRRRLALKERWIVLENDGSYTIVGRQSDPTREEITAFDAALREAGKGGWLAKTEGRHHEPGKVPEVIRVEALGRLAGGKFEEAVAAFGRRILERNAP